MPWGNRFWATLSSIGAVFTKDAEEEKGAGAAGKKGKSSGKASLPHTPHDSENDGKPQSGKGRSESAPKLEFDGVALTERTSAVWLKPLAQSSVAIDLPRLAGLTTLLVNGEPAPQVERPDGDEEPFPSEETPVWYLLYRLALLLDGPAVADRIRTQLPGEIPGLCRPKAESSGPAFTGLLKAFLGTVIGEDSRTVRLLAGTTQGAIAPTVATLYALCAPKAFLDAGYWNITLDIRTDVDTGEALSATIVHHKRQRGPPNRDTGNSPFEFLWSLTLDTEGDFSAMGSAVLQIEEVKDLTPDDSDEDAVGFLLHIQTELQRAR